jgi:cytochrome c1
MQKALYSLLKAALTQPLHTSADALEEAHENPFYLKIAEFKLFLGAASALEIWLAAVVAGKRQQLQQQRGGYAMQFYCWHDAQASQLRFSLVAAAAPLPFGFPVRLVELSVVVQAFLTQQHLVFDENLFEFASPAGQLAAAQAAIEEFVLPVWQIVIS